jgi:hypothetical protein
MMHLTFTTMLPTVTAFGIDEVSRRAMDAVAAGGELAAAVCLWVVAFRCRIDAYDEILHRIAAG